MKTSDLDISVLQIYICAIQIVVVDLLRTQKLAEKFISVTLKQFL